MHKFETGLLIATFAIVGCADEMGGASMRKGEVDVSALSAHAELTVEGPLAQVTVPFATPVPDVPARDFAEALDGALALRVVSLASGASAELVAKVVADGEPTGPGQFALEVEDDRDAATVAFWRPDGALRLSSGSTYTAQLFVATNDYVERLASVTFDVSIVGG